MWGANRDQSELSRAWIQAGSASAVAREVSATRRAGSLLARPCSRLARRRRAASSEPGSRSPARSRSSPVSDEHLVGETGQARKLLGAAAHAALGHVCLPVPRQYRGGGVDVAYRGQAFF